MLGQGSELVLRDETASSSTRLHILNRAFGFGEATFQPRGLSKSFQKSVPPQIPRLAQNSVPYYMNLSPQRAATGQSLARSKPLRDELDCSFPDVPNSPPRDQVFNQQSYNTPRTASSRSHDDDPGNALSVPLRNDTPLPARSKSTNPVDRRWVNLGAGSSFLQVSSDEGSETASNQKLGRRGRLDPETRKNAAEMRERGACLRCRLSKQPVSFIHAFSMNKTAV